MCCKYGILSYGGKSPGVDPSGDIYSNVLFPDPNQGYNIDLMILAGVGWGALAGCDDKLRSTKSYIHL